MTRIIRYGNALECIDTTITISNWQPIEFGRRPSGFNAMLARVMRRCVHYSMGEMC